MWYCNRHAAPGIIIASGEEFRHAQEWCFAVVNGEKSWFHLPELSKAPSGEEYGSGEPTVQVRFQNRPAARCEVPNINRSRRKGEDVSGRVLHLVMLKIMGMRHQILCVALRTLREWSRLYTIDFFIRLPLPQRDNSSGRRFLGFQQAGVGVVNLYLSKSDPLFAA